MGAVRLFPCLMHCLQVYIHAEICSLCRSPSWRIFTQRLGAYGEGYTGPGYNRIRERLLQDAVQRLDVRMKLFWEEAVRTGIVLMSDGWTDTCHRPLMKYWQARPRALPSSLQ